MATLAKCYMEILIDVYRNEATYTFEQLKEKYNANDIRYLVKQNCLKFVQYEDKEDNAEI